jgi:hypothetical protein
LPELPKPTLPTIPKDINPSHSTASPWIIIPRSSSFLGVVLPDN